MAHWYHQDLIDVLKHVCLCRIYGNQSLHTSEERVALLGLPRAEDQKCYPLLIAIGGWSLQPFIQLFMRSFKSEIVLMF